MTNNKERMERTQFLGSHLAKHFAKRYSRLTNDEKDTIERIEKHILTTYETDSTPNKKLFNELLDTLEEMNDRSGKKTAYERTFDWLINIWDEICNINLELEESE